MSIFFDMIKSLTHVPVLAKESLQGLEIAPDGVYVDATFGRGGHSQMVLNALGEKGTLVAFDQDITAIEHAKTAISDDRFTIFHQNFAKIAETLTANGIHDVDGILMDIGVSSPQLDDAERGFSFMRDGPLDMRMDQSQGQTAYQYLLQVSEEDLSYALSVYGEERHAKRVARYIIQARKDQKLENSTQSLVKIIEQSGVKRDRHKHAATRTFQAIRMVVNREVEVLEDGLVGALASLRIGGRLVIISFHGLEHRVVKAFVRKYRQKDGDMVLKMVGKAQGVSFLEQRTNPRSRSAYIRVMERIK